MRYIYTYQDFQRIQGYSPTSIELRVKNKINRIKKMLMRFFSPFHFTPYTEKGNNNNKKMRLILSCVFWIFVTEFQQNQAEIVRDITTEDKMACTDELEIFVNCQLIAKNNKCHEKCYADICCLSCSVQQQKHIMENIETLNHQENSTNLSENDIIINKNMANNNSVYDEEYIDYYEEYETESYSNNDIYKNNNVTNNLWKYFDKRLMYDVHDENYNDYTTGDESYYLEEDLEDDDHFTEKLFTTSTIKLKTTNNIYTTATSTTTTATSTTTTTTTTATSTTTTTTSTTTITTVATSTTTTSTSTITISSTYYDFPTSHLHQITNFPIDDEDFIFEGSGYENFMEIFEEGSGHHDFF